jgi:L-asparagine transporter-like permease
MSDSQRGFGLEIEFIDHLQIITTNHYNSIDNFHNLEITTAHAKSFQSSAFSTSRSLVTASNNEDSSTAPTKSSIHRFPYN